MRRVVSKSGSRWRWVRWIRIQWMLCAAAGFAGLGLGALIGAAGPTAWQADVLVRLSPGIDGAEDLATEVTLLTSRPVLREVAHRIEVEPDQIAPPRALDAAVDAMRNLIVSPAVADVGTDPVVAREAALLRALNVRIEPGTHLLRLAAVTPDPELSQRIANAVLDAHLALRLGLTGVPPLAVVARADAPLVPNPLRPFGPWALALGLTGLLLPAALTLLREVGRTGFRTPEEVEGETGLPVLGRLPSSGERRRPPVETVSRKPASHLSEAVRGLRTSILLGGPARDPRVVVVTSSVPEEGKSTAAALLAQTMARWGRRVLLIEADIRRQSFAHMFELEPGPGILSVLADLLPLEAAVRRPDGHSFDILLGEAAASTNAADILATGRFQRFLEEARSVYDCVVIDTPPVLLVPDARIVAPQADALLYIVRWERTHRAQVTRGLEELRQVGAEPAGIVLNRIDQQQLERDGLGDSYGGVRARSHYYLT
ncbi:MAG: polysaccharide biosynthesis tyrosine autokinase [Pseudomonadota bacterium]